MKILLVEDDQAARALLEKVLTAHYTVEGAKDGRSALALAEQGEYDLLILDVDLPQLDGISVCQQLRTQGDRTPILLLTAKDGVSDRVLGLDAGADDYLVKPFHPPELLARIRALLRRGGATVATIVTWENLRLNCVTHEVHYGDQILRLTPKEHGILELLLLHPQRIFSRAALIDRLWELGESPTESAISSHIKAIRQKLKAAGAMQDLIETMYGFGYRLRSIETETGSPGSSAPSLEVAELPNPVELPVYKTPEAAETALIADTIMAGLWEQFKDSFSHQIESLDRAIVAIEEGQITAALRQEAKQTAHKLAGSLGMFGLPHGSVLAKQMETLLHADIVLTIVEIDQLVAGMAALRQELAQKSPASFLSESQSQPPLVLVVSDDPAVTDPLYAEAAERSRRITVFSTTAAAQLMVERSLPAVILLDLTREESASAGLQWLAQLQQQQPQIPVLVFIDRDNQRDRLAVSRLGARQLLHKPATSEQVFQAIAHALPLPIATAATVLVVDDDPGALAVLSSMLTPWGLEIVTLSEPQRFWQVLGLTSPSLVLLDLEMPQVSGLELCQLVRQDPQWGNLPILVVTAHTDADSLRQAFAAGADDFVTKPVLGPELVTRVLSRIR